ncbi:MAG: aspartate aminotransferase family protein [Syntrophothermus sp.]
MRASASLGTAPGLYNNPVVKAENDGKALLGNYSRYHVEFASGDGAYLYDKEGNRYLDFLSGIAVTGFGHNNYTIKMAVEDQLNKLWHVSNLFEASGQEELAQKLVSKTGLGKVFFCNSGTEANEAAIKFARKWGHGRSEIITALGGFHGRTMGSLSATAQYKVWEGFFPLTPGFKYVPFGDLNAIEHTITSSTVAIMVEPIQGESGIVVPHKGYLKGLREICDRHNLLLIFDEVQAGMGRTGKFFAYQWEDIKPDIITSAKGIANGIPLGAVICTEEVGSVMVPGSHGSTFGGNPLAIAAANKVADLLDEDTLSTIESYGNMLKNAIIGLNLDCIKEVRGKGLLIGIELEEGKSAKATAKKLLENRVVIGVSGDNVLRILPPFIITEKEILNFVLALEKVLTSE